MIHVIKISAVLYSIMVCSLYGQYTITQPISATNSTNNTNKKNINAFLQEDPLVVPVIMVKNEALVLEKTLQPYVDVGINHFFVFDTGSTDNTLDVARNFFKKNNITYGYSAQEPFVNFEISRNRALTLAEQTFPNATFMIMPDAEWYLQNPQGLIDFCLEHRHDPVSAFAIRIIHQGRTDYVNLRLVRCRTNTRFVGAVHEYIYGDLRNVLPRSVYFAWNDEERGFQKSNARWFRDLTILQDEYAKNPKDPRTVFYLAQTYDCLGMPDEAYAHYKERAAMDVSEEAFSAQYRAGIVWDRVGNWQKALDEYLLAFAMDPSRAEPLIRIADHYGKPEYASICKLFAQEACKKPYPENAYLLVDKDLYDVKRHDLLAYSSWFTHDYATTLKSLKKALLGDPSAQHIQKNIPLVEDTLKKQSVTSKNSAVLHIHFRAEGRGGIENHITQLFSELSSYALKNIVLTSYHSQHLTRVINEQQPAIRTLHYYHDDFYPRLEDIEHHVVDQNVGLIICNSRGHLAACAQLRKKYPLRVIYMHHFLFNFTNDNLSYLSACDAVVTADPVTAQQLQQLRDQGIIQTPLIQHIPPYCNEYDLVRQHPSMSNADFFKTYYGIAINPAAPVITMVANMYDELYKNHPLLLKSAAQLKKNGKQFNLILAGDGHIKSTFIKQAHDLGINDCTFFIGSTEHVAQLLEHTDIHILTSTTEGFGLAHVEAAMKRKPIVAARGTGIAPYVQPLINGMLFENNNQDDVVNTLSYLLEHPQERITMGNNAYALAREQFATGLLTRQWLSLITHVMQ